MQPIKWSPVADHDTTQVSEVPAAAVSVCEGSRVSEAVKACNAEVDAVLNSISNPRRHTPATVGGIKLSTASE